MLRLKCASVACQNNVRGSLRLDRIKPYTPAHEITADMFSCGWKKRSPPYAARMIDRSLVRQGYLTSPVGSGGQLLRWKTPNSSWWCVGEELT